MGRATRNLVQSVKKEVRPTNDAGVKSTVAMVTVKGKASWARRIKFLVCKLLLFPSLSTTARILKEVSWQREHRGLWFQLSITEQTLERWFRAETQICGHLPWLYGFSQTDVGCMGPLGPTLNYQITNEPVSKMIWEPASHERLCKKTRNMKPPHSLFSFLPAFLFFNNLIVGNKSWSSSIVTRIIFGRISCYLFISHTCETTYSSVIGLSHMALCFYVNFPTKLQTLLWRSSYSSLYQLNAQNSTELIPHLAFISKHLFSTFYMPYLGTTTQAYNKSQLLPSRCSRSNKGKG